MHGFLQGLQEAGAVLAGEGRVVALALAGLAQVPEIAHGQRHADAGLREGPAGRSDDAGAGLQAAGGQRDIGRDDDIALGRALGDEPHPSYKAFLAIAEVRPLRQARSRSSSLIEQT